MDLFQDEFNLEQVFSDYTSDIFKALIDNPRLDDDYLNMLINDKKGTLVAEAVTETLKYFGFMECHFPEKYDTATINKIIESKKTDIEL